MTDLIITNNEDNFQDIAEQKRLLRKQLRAMRRALTREEVETASSAAAQRVIALPEFQKAELILSFNSYTTQILVHVTCFCFWLCWVFVVLYWGFSCCRA